MGFNDVRIFSLLLIEEFFAKDTVTFDCAYVQVIFLDEYFSFLDEEE